MTSTEVAPRVKTANDRPPPSEPASWPARAGALSLDVLPGAAVLATAAMVALSVPLHGGWWWMSVFIAVAAVSWTVVNRVLLPGASGQSLGRRAFGIELVYRAGSPVGPWTLLLRDMTHLLDTVPALAGWLWPLKDSRRRTFADALWGTEAHVVEAPITDGSRRNTACVLLVAAALCAVDATVSVAVVRQRDSSSSDATAEIAAQGPHMVEQILSYHPETVQGDFDRARTLASDAYRGQLIAQQQAVVKAGLVRNDYWVTDSSVLSATRGRATMLLFLQGRRGAAPDQRYLTASVRVNFVESDSTPWRVDELTVVTSPPTVKANP
ncbi:RDD family protein [Mycobacterium antarcticum]|uniref:RDD family protein n=1 Tax=Mycolicibacterium sp. TUM20984 TaxID=3023368 RepID=UPI0023A17959|nr:RDD family protein [Mycolicibacterium sp. TUM20984]GLP82648.1 RDD family protein [Mycolicibacterium sp. TUM20984]